MNPLTKCSEKSSGIFFPFRYFHKNPGDAMLDWETRQCGIGTPVVMKDLSFLSDLSLRIQAMLDWDTRRCGIGTPVVMKDPSFLLDLSLRIQAMLDWDIRRCGIGTSSGLDCYERTFFPFRAFLKNLGDVRLGHQIFQKVTHLGIAPTGARLTLEPLRAP
ncbi:hypothetical protein FNV43_RR15365 [Rhamnella rubrinervis]|uniref:Uncharacterized protein n=1 Tax=Rhamnella rubrinervis TaxID=2594499 RepID=A0A8K0E781_9ROSA|nr:hypothetical protein FNV43_RR15365 [Rhamnella rubrinervis]